MSENVENQSKDPRSLLQMFEDCDHDSINKLLLKQQNTITVEEIDDELLRYLVVEYFDLDSCYKAKREKVEELEIKINCQESNIKARDEKIETLTKENQDLKEKIYEQRSEINKLNDIINAFVRLIARN